MAEISLHWARAAGARGRRPRALVTGFEPFHRWRVNSSWEGAAALVRRRPDLVAVRLPVDHARAAETLRAALAVVRPRVLLMTGLAPGRACRLERIGREAAAEGSAGAGTARAGDWPWGAAEEALNRAGASWRRSEDAGGYVCDTAYAAALAHRATQGWPERAAFLHVPPLSAVWDRDRVAAAIEAALAPLAAPPNRRAGPGAGF